MSARRLGRLWVDECVVNALSRCVWFGSIEREARYLPPLGSSYLSNTLSLGLSPRGSELAVLRMGAFGFVDGVLDCVFFELRFDGCE